MWTDDSIYLFCNCWNALAAQGSARFFVFVFVFFFSAHEYRNIGMVIWTWFIKKNLRNILGLYGKNTKKLSACLEKRVS